MQYKQAIQALCDSEVDFVVIGGVAGSIHGSAQVTYDLDISFSRDSVKSKAPG